MTGGITLEETKLTNRELLGAVLRFVERPAFTLTRAYNTPAMSSARRIANSVLSGTLPPDMATNFERAAKGVAKVATVAAGGFAHALRADTGLRSGVSLKVHPIAKIELRYPTRVTRLVRDGRKSRGISESRSGAASAPSQ